MKRILIADDIGQNRYMLTALLEGSGYEVVAATNGAEALSLAQGAPPDMVVSDLLMPVMDGFELCRRWKQDERLKRIPFVVFTATYTDPKDERLALSLGADRFLVKPLPVETLLQVVREVLEAGGRDPAAVRSGLTGEEVELLRAYNEALTRKLEKKVRDLESEIARRDAVEAALRESERRFRLLAENARDVVWSMGVDGRLTYVSPSVESLRGYTAEEVMNERVEDSVFPQGLALLQAELFPVLADLGAGRGSGRSGLFELELRCKDGRTVWVEISAGVMRDEGGAVVGIQGVTRDITRRRQVEEELRRTTALLDSIIEHLPHMVFLKDARDLRFVRLNRAGEEMLGYSRAELLGKSDLDFFPREQADFFTSMDRETLRRGTVVDIPEEPVRTRTGDVRILHTKKVSLLDARGEPEFLLGISEDITELKRIEEERRNLQSQLFQSQKVESIGRLAGGIAHDFNNLLTAILGYSALIVAGLREGDPLRNDVEEIMKAGSRAAALTRQLLAFSRKQVLSPVTLDLNSVVTGMERLLGRLIGEDVALATVLAPALGPVCADPNQIEQVIMNLAVNARDAMPRGGRLTIETADVDIDETFVGLHAGARPGSFVRLAVSDTGCGMDAETLSHLFEPFFTTKEIGKGTGLGLATVYGIVKQSDGFIDVYSEVGKGTTFKVYLPRTVKPAGTEARRDATAASIRGSETILLVEDEDIVRNLAHRVLTAYGYKVIAARDGGAALLACERSPDPIALMVTDVVMPGMSGRELALRLSPLRPEMKVLYLSGYSAGAIALTGIVESGVALLEKPFAPEALVRKVRAVLDAPAAGAPPGPLK
jgi:PAS domain S-box-containing protein